MLATTSLASTSEFFSPVFPHRCQNVTFVRLSHLAVYQRRTHAEESEKDYKRLVGTARARSRFVPNRETRSGRAQKSWKKDKKRPVKLTHGEGLVAKLEAAACGGAEKGPKKAAQSCSRTEKANMFGKAAAWLRRG